jgi:PAS domain S-box-containing protein
MSTYSDSKIDEEQLDNSESYRRRAERLEAKLSEASETLDAIRCGDVDAVVVSGPNGHKVYTLENADRPYRLLIEQMQEGAVTLTKEGLILYCNHTLATILKTPVQHVIGASFVDFVREEELTIFNNLLAEGGKEEILLKTGDGDTVQTALSFNEMLDEDGTIICGVVTDITLHKTQVQELAEKNQRLQKEILEREKTEESLRQAQKMEAVGQLTGGLAHDFNNLLTVILGNLQMISGKANGNEKLAEYVNNAITATDRGASLTQKLLAFSRRQALNSETVKVSNLFSGIQMLAKQVVGVDIEMVFRAPEDLWYCFTDANQLESAILNLIINSRDAMPAGGQLTIEVTNVTLDASVRGITPDPTPGRYVMITVSDTGIGIPEEAMNHVFEPFFTTKELGKGSGLGLSMVYGFIRQTNGFISIDSQAGVGTNICLYLPYTDAPVPVVHKHAAGMESQREASATILVVEDDEDVLKVVRDLIEDMGYQVISATNAYQALHIIEQDQDRRINLIFSDVVMPGGMSGLDLARELRNKRSEVPVLLTSGYISQSMDYNDNLAAEFQLLRKPYHRKDLSAAIQEALGRSLDTLQYT